MKLSLLEAKIWPLGLDGFWPSCPKAPDRKRREVRKRQILFGKGVWLCQAQHFPSH